LQDHPAVVYFHNNQLPDLTQAVNQQPLDLTNLTSATAASEIWFNSKQHVGTFLEGIEGMITLTPELQSRNPMDDVLAKLHLVPPPVDTNFFRESAAGSATERDPSAIFVETRDANMDLLNTALVMLRARNNPIQMYVCGPIDQLTNVFPVQQISEIDSTAQVRALLAAGTFVSTKIAVPFDENAVRAMSLGCRPVLPHTGIYPELVPMGLHSECLYDMSAESLASHLHEATYLPSIYRLDELTSKLKPYEPLHACAIMDSRLDTLAAEHARAGYDHTRHPLREARRRAIPHA
jgi:hypothetical protein